MNVLAVFVASFLGHRASTDPGGCARRAGCGCLIMLAAFVLLILAMPMIFAAMSGTGGS